MTIQTPTPYPGPRTATPQNAGHTTQPQRWAHRRLVGPATAANRLGLEPRALLLLVNAGTLPAYRFDGAVRFNPDDIETVQRELAQIPVPLAAAI